MSDDQADKDRAARQAIGERQKLEAQAVARHVAEREKVSPVTIREQAVLEKRIAEDEARYRQGMPVAGHGEDDGQRQRRSRSR